MLAMAGKTKKKKKSHLVLQPAALDFHTPSLTFPAYLTSESPYPEVSHILGEQLNTHGCQMMKAGCDLCVKGSYRRCKAGEW